MRFLRFTVYMNRLLNEALAYNQNKNNLSWIEMKIGIKNESLTPIKCLSHTLPSAVCIRWKLGLLRFSLLRPRRLLRLRLLRFRLLLLLILSKRTSRFFIRRLLFGTCLIHHKTEIWINLKLEKKLGRNFCFLRTLDHSETY